MSNPHRTLAEIHKFSINPADPRTLNELESYYRNLSHGSPFARACSELIAEDTAQNAQEFAELTTKAAMVRADNGADEMAEMLQYARDCADIWAHLCADEMREQVDAHLESNYPEASDEAREAVVRKVCGD